MPASLAHYQFALRVLTRQQRQGEPLACRDAVLFGAQGPDIFFFHRVFPWQPGRSYVWLGQREHRISPVRLFNALRAGLNAAAVDRPVALAYVQGLLCHYALDRAAHPYVLWAQQVLRQQQPRYGRTDNQYHFRIESALDTLVLRRETGRRIGGFDLRTLVPAVAADPRSGLSAAVGQLHAWVARLAFATTVPAEALTVAGHDMRHALGWLTDRTQLRRGALRPFEWASRQGHIATSLLRPADTSDWDYANVARQEWHNPFDPRYRSRDSFFDVYDRAVDEALDMIAALGDGRPPADADNCADMRALTQDRGFASDLPGVYEES